MNVLNEFVEESIQRKKEIVETRELERKVALAEHRRAKVDLIKQKGQRLTSVTNGTSLNGLIPVVKLPSMLRDSVRQPKLPGQFISRVIYASIDRSIQYQS